MKEEPGIEDDEELGVLLEACLLTGDRDLYKAIETRIKQQWAKRVGSGDPFFPYPQAEVTNGPIKLGQPIP